MEKLDIWGNIVVPEWFNYCPGCGSDRREMFGLGHGASCEYGTGRDHAGAKERREKWAKISLDKLRK